MKERAAIRIKMNTPELQADFRRAVQEYRPDIIGFSALEITYDQTARLIGGVKDLPIPIIVGVMYPTFAPQQVMKDPYVDMICEGEGELAFRELVDKFALVGDVSKLFDIQRYDNGNGGKVRRNFQPPESLIRTPNIAMRVGGNDKDKFYRGGLEVDIEDFGSGDYLESEKVGLQRPDVDMEKLLTPDYTIYEDKRFIKPMGDEFFRAICVETARGCPYECTFCCIPQQQAHHEAALKLREKIRGNGTGLEYELLKNVDSIEVAHHKQKSPQKFIGEARKAIEEHGVNYLFFGDETFLAKSHKWLSTFFHEYDKLSLPPGSLPRSFIKKHPRFVREDGTERIPFFISTRVETVSNPRTAIYAKELERIGCHNCAMGIESGDQHYRSQFLKRMMPDSTIISGFKAFGDTDILISANNIIGMPMETREDIFNTIKINRNVNPDNIIVNAFRPYTGTPLRHKCIEMGLIERGVRAEDNRALEQFYNGVMSAREIEGLRRTFVLYVTFPEKRWAEINRAEQNDKEFEKLSREFYEADLLDKKKRKSLLVNRYDSSERSLNAIEKAGVMITDPQ